MEIAALLKSKDIKSKEKVSLLARALLSNEITPDALIDHAATAKDTEKADCIEAIELASKANPHIGSEKLFHFVVDSLSCKAARVKWESAKVIGNIAHLYPKKLDKAIVSLLINSEDKGTVVRWSAAYALGEIIKLRTLNNKELLPAVESIVKREEKNSIRKIYLDAVKEASKF